MWYIRASLDTIYLSFSVSKMRDVMQASVRRALIFLASLAPSCAMYLAQQ